MSSMITRHFVRVGDRQIHYRRTGHGPPVVLLHQSPTSSRECEPLLRQLAGSHSVFAPDMPGYGASEPLPERHPTIESLADNVASFMDAAGIEVAGMYGFHTGASVATAFARRHPSRVSVSVVVGLLCLTAQERERLLREYAPPFVPAWDGSHLAWLWSRLKDQSVVFPWFSRTAVDRVVMDALPPAAIQNNLPDWLRSGERYRDAYEAAFRYRPESDLPAIRTPHVVVDFATDPLYEHLARLPAGLDTFEIVRCATAADAQTIACKVLRRYPGSAMARNVTVLRPPVDKISQDYVTVAGMQLRMLSAGDAASRPVVVQHGAQSSAAAYAGLITALSGHCAAVALELPGHGESDALPERADYGIEALAALMGAIIKGLGIAEPDLIGIEAGAAIHTELAARKDVRVGRATLVSAIDAGHDPALRHSLLEGYPTPAPPDFFGGHLLRAWHETRDHRLFFPWTERRRQFAVGADPCLDPALLHGAMVERILSGAAGCAVRRAEILYPLSARLSTLKCHVTFAAPRSDSRFDHTHRTAEAAARGFVELGGEPREWHRLLAP